MQRQLRLRRNADFQRVRAEGRTWANRYLVLAVAPNALPHNRYGIIASRKVGNAVVRNRVKRRIRAVIHHWHPQIAPGHDIILIVRSGAVVSTPTALSNAIQSLLKRANLLSLS